MEMELLKKIHFGYTYKMPAKSVYDWIPPAISFFAGVAPNHFQGLLSPSVLRKLLLTDHPLSTCRADEDQYSITGDMEAVSPF